MVKLSGSLQLVVPLDTTTAEAIHVPFEVESLYTHVAFTV